MFTKLTHGLEQTFLARSFLTELGLSTELLKNLLSSASGWNELVQTGAKLERNMANFCQARTGLVPLYEDAINVKPKFDE